MDKSLKGRTFKYLNTGEEFEVIQCFIGPDAYTHQVKLQHIGSTRITHETIANLMNPLYYVETSPQSAEDEDSNTSYEIEVKWANDGFATTFTGGVEMDYQYNAILIYDENKVLIHVINIDKVRYVTLKKK